MIQIIRCPKCMGKGKILGPGYMEHICDECKGTLTVEVKSVEILPVETLPDESLPIETNREILKNESSDTKKRGRQKKA